MEGGRRRETSQYIRGFILAMYLNTYTYIDRVNQTRPDYIIG